MKYKNQKLQIYDPNAYLKRNKKQEQDRYYWRTKTKRSLMVCLPLPCVLLAKEKGRGWQHGKFHDIAHLIQEQPIKREFHTDLCHRVQP